MPIARCVLCGEVRPLGLFFRVCRECFAADRTGERLDQAIAEQGLVAPSGSLIYRPHKDAVETK